MSAKAKAVALVAAVVVGLGVLVGGQAPPATGVVVVTGARFIGVGAPDVAHGFLIVRDGRVEVMGAGVPAPVPAGARVVDLGGRFVLPGFVSAHAHVSDVNGVGPRAYTDANTRRQLEVFARYGVTTVWSLGGEQAPAFHARDRQATPTLDRARLFVAGAVVTATTPEDARRDVATLAAQGVDVVKIRVDDNLGTATKMPPAVYRTVIEEAHRHGLRVAAHVFYLADAKDLVRAGADVIAHSVRDQEIDDEFIALMRERDIAYCPTLTRELSTFVYESTPAFFDDPFFRREADPAVVAWLLDPARQQAMRESRSAQGYKAALPVARRNLKRAADAGVLIAMGTDAGPAPERFVGYFEHLEMEMMVESGMRPIDVLTAATEGAARAMRLSDVGRLAPGAWADFVVLDRDPRMDIRDTRSIASVWVAGNQLPR